MRHNSRNTILCQKKKIIIGLYHIYRQSCHFLSISTLVIVNDVLKKNINGKTLEG